jgi:phosphoribosylanthranilate isomerase
MSVLVKVCGITQAADAAEAVALGAAAIGFVFWPRSPRYIEPGRAGDIVATLPSGVLAVGVFVDAAPDAVARIVEAAGLGAVQLHGDEDAARYVGSAPRIVKAVAVRDGIDLSAVVDAVPPAVTVLLDAHDPVRRGGTGRTIDWAAAAAVASSRPVILSGGLHAGNVSAAVEAVRPHAVDVSSGVERAPGVKDPARLRAFFEALRPLGGAAAPGASGFVPSAARAHPPASGTSTPVNR